MTDFLKQFIEQFSNLFKWWVIVLPWEQGVKVRYGKKIKRLNGGIHFRIPYLDSVYVMPIRLRFVSLVPQTVTNRSGKTLTVSMIVGYKINDIERVYHSVSELDGSVAGIVMGHVAKFISESAMEQCTVIALEESVIGKLRESNWGIQIDKVSATTFAEVRTYRVIQDSNWMVEGQRIDIKR